MQVQKIDNQNSFTGKIVYVDDYSKQSAQSMRKYMKGHYGYKLKKVRNMLKHKPYDVFVTHVPSDGKLGGHFVVEADRTYELALQNRQDKAIEKVHESNPIAIPWAVEYAVKNYTDFVKYEKSLHEMGLK